ncbi:MAG: hypothetical protein ACT4UP_05265 [Gammaproteobacteria bacterium]
MLAGLALTIAIPATAVAQSIPTTTGWHPLADTKIRSVCAAVPSLLGNEGCSAITEDWSGGTFDTTRNRLLIWGGGHFGYLGNEVYALEVGSPAIRRLNDSSLNPPTTCSHNGSMPDGTPVSRHTYNHLAYIAHADRMYAFGGSGVPCGWMLGDTWTLNLATLQWQRMNPTGPNPEANYGRVAAYDPDTRKVYIHDALNLFSYSLESNSYTRLTNDQVLSQEMTATIDTKRKLFVIVGDGAVYAYSLAAGTNFARQVWNTTGATNAVSGHYIGLAYDPVTDRIVAWNGGNTVYSLNPDTRVWSAITHPNGPGPALANGTFGRFAYSAASGVFVVINSVDNNAYALRLALPTPPPNPPTQVNVN